MSATYAELHCHSSYSFQEGASSVGELLFRAKALGYPAVALTDHDNLCGAMKFARIATSLGIQPITGAEVTLKDGSHLSLLAETRKGYGNLCRLITYSRIAGDRRSPGLDPKYLSPHAEGLILLTGCSKGRVPTLVADGRWREAQGEVEAYLEGFGVGNVFIELQQNLVRGDTPRNRLLHQLARNLGVGVVATNNVHYHVPQRHRLQDALVAIRHGKKLEESHRERRPNANFYLKSPTEMEQLFQDTPEALRNSIHIAERCTFDLTRSLGYEFPDYPVPDGYTPQSYLEKLCHEAARRKYRSITPRVQERLNEEFRLIEKHNLSGFFLIYHDIIQIAHEVMADLGKGDREVPVEERPPGRGRGSSVAMLVGYLIGLSHIDPLEFNLSLDRFLSDDMGTVPDIDLDFPRDIREELIKRVHKKWGWDHAALTGMISTYQMKGAIRDLGKVLGLPSGSMATDHVTLSRAIASLTLDSSFSNSNSGECTPTTTSPLLAYLSFQSLKYGNVRRQLMHVYVQKSTSTTLPRNSSIERGWLLIHCVIPVKSAAVGPLGSPPDDGEAEAPSPVDVGNGSAAGAGGAGSRVSWTTTMTTAIAAKAAANAVQRLNLSIRPPCAGEWVSHDLLPQTGL